MSSFANSNSYALAIFATAKDKNQQEKFYQQISALDAFNNTNPDFFKVLSARSINRKERQELAKTILSGFGFEQQVIYFVWTIIENNSYQYFHKIALACRERHHDLFGIVRVKVTSANELSEQQLNKIRSFFETKLNEKIELAWHIKPDLIGGLRIQVNNRTYNNTFRAKLANLKNELLIKEE